MRRTSLVATLLAAALVGGCSASQQPALGAASEPGMGTPPGGASDEPAGDDSSIEWQLLAAHNRARAEHCAPPLAWSDALADEASRWAQSLAANNCAFEHSDTAHGENLAGGSTGALDPGRVVAMWVDERDQYDFSAPEFAMDTGHFTQVVWKGTSKLGCGSATCDGLDIWVCNYDPAGNVMDDFAGNVAPRSCR